uniref:Uncharacterized protein n=1 Tax=Megaselia scalaris TaxID=36166 RepID=T1GBJ5_MEGSC
MLKYQYNLGLHIAVLMHQTYCEQTYCKKWSEFFANRLTLYLLPAISEVIDQQTIPLLFRNKKQLVWLLFLDTRSTNLSYATLANMRHFRYYYAIRDWQLVWFKSSTEANDEFLANKVKRSKFCTTKQNSFCAPYLQQQHLVESIVEICCSHSIIFFIAQSSRTQISEVPRTSSM